MLADVGLVGIPSVGKSTIISCVSRSKPKIAAYHFTTLTPNLGVATVYESTFDPRNKFNIFYSNINNSNLYEYKT